MTTASIAEIQKEIVEEFSLFEDYFCAEAFRGCGFPIGLVKERVQLDVLKREFLCDGTSQSRLP